MVRADFDEFDRKEVARLLALAEAQRRSYQEMVDALPDPVAVLAADKTVVWANRAFRQSFGVRAGDLRGKTLEQVLKPMPATIQAPLRRWDDEDEIETLVVVSTAPEPPREQTAQPSAAAARADALYTFAGRVAHDLNNPLMIVTGYAEELLESLPPNDPQRKNVSEILTAAGRISVLGGQLIDIARKHARPPAPVNLAEVVAAAKIKGVRVSAGPPVVALADAEQLAEAIQAVAAGRTNVAISWDVEGRYTRIHVQAEGPALDANVFDPVLTKTVDPAAGMTFARAYSIVREWGGDIAVAGSGFTIYLPSAESAAAPAPKSSGESILVVEDEAVVRRLIVKILQREGYHVTDVASAEEALAAARANPVRLLITDVRLPGMSGPDLARRLHTATPELKVLYISGYTDDPAARAGSHPPGAGFLAKPFTLNALVAKVRDTL